MSSRMSWRMAVVRGGLTASNHREPPRPALVQSQQGLRSPYACVQRGKTTLNLPEHVFLAPLIYTLQGKNMVLPVAWGTCKCDNLLVSVQRSISYTVSSLL